MKKDTRNIRNRLFEIGEKQYQFGRIGIFRILPISIALIVLFFIGQFVFGGDLETFIEGLAFEFGMLEGLQAIIVLAMYLGFLCSFISVPCYFSGLHFLGLAQISENTEKK